MPFSYFLPFKDTGGNIPPLLVHVMNCMCGVQLLARIIGCMIEPNSTIPPFCTIVTVFFISFTHEQVIHNLIKSNLITMRQPY